MPNYSVNFEKVSVISKPTSRIQKKRYSHIPPQHRGHLTATRAYPAPLPAALLWDYVLRQDPVVLDWIKARVAEYATTFPAWTLKERQIVSALDIVLWQREAEIQGKSRNERERNLFTFLVDIDTIYKERVSQCMEVGNDENTNP